MVIFRSDAAHRAVEQSGLPVGSTRNAYVILWYCTGGSYVFVVAPAMAVQLVGMLVPVGADTIPGDEYH